MSDSIKKSKEIMLNFHEELIERDSAICQFYMYFISTTKSNKSTILEKIRTNKFTKCIFLITSNKTVVNLVFGILRNSRVMKTIILHGLAKSGFKIKEDKLDFIFFKKENKSVDEKIGQALAKKTKTIQLVLKFTNTTNVIGRIMPKHFSDSFTASFHTEFSLSVSTSMHHKSIKDDVVKTARYGKYSERKVQVSVKRLTNNIKLGFSFRQKNCRPGYYPIYTAHNRYCWMCMFCKIKYFKTAEGQDGCAKCDEKTLLTNENRTMCIPFTYQYYQIEGNNKKIVFIFAAIGSLYSTFILFVFAK